MADEAVQSLLKQPLSTISNNLMMNFINHNLIQITSFKEERMAPSAYQLSPFKIRLRNDDEEGLGPEERFFISKARLSICVQANTRLYRPKKELTSAKDLLQISMLRLGASIRD